MGTVTFPTSSITTPSGDPGTLPPATVPLVGTELMEIYEGGAWKYLTTDNFTAGRVINTGGVNVTGTDIPTNGLYLPAANTVGLATNGVLRVSVSTSLVTLASGMGLTLSSGNLTVSEGVVSITTTNSGTGPLTLVANSLAAGSLLSASSNSGDTSARGLIDVINDNSAATGAYCLRMQQDAANAFINYVGTAAASTTDPISTLTTSGATTHHIQIDINGTKAWVAASTNNPS